MDTKIKFEIDLAKKLGEFAKHLEGVAPILAQQANQAVKDVAESAYATIMAKAQTKLHKTREAYISALKFEELGEHSYLISLEGDWANALEDGFIPFDMTERMLKSATRVSKGQNAGQPWVRENKQDGKKYARVPLPPQGGVNPTAPGIGNLADAIKSLKSKNAKGRDQSILSVFKDTEGKPLEGKVASMGTVGIYDVQSRNPIFDGLTKYQKTVYDKQGKAHTQSTYIAYRTVSEKGKPWIHPGFMGIQAFEEAERQIVKNIDQIIKEML